MKRPTTPITGRTGDLLSSSPTPAELLDESAYEILSNFTPSAASSDTGATTNLSDSDDCEFPEAVSNDGSDDELLDTEDSDEDISSETEGMRTTLMGETGEVGDDEQLEMLARDMSESFNRHRQRGQRGQQRQQREGEDPLSLLSFLTEQVKLVDRTTRLRIAFTVVLVFSAVFSSLALNWALPSRGMTNLSVGKSILIETSTVTTTATSIAMTTSTTTVAIMKKPSSALVKHESFKPPAPPAKASQNVRPKVVTNMEKTGREIWGTALAKYRHHGPPENEVRGKVLPMKKKTTTTTTTTAKVEKPGHHLIKVLAKHEMRVIEWVQQTADMVLRNTEQSINRARSQAVIGMHHAFLSATSVKKFKTLAKAQARVKKLQKKLVKATIALEKANQKRMRDLQRKLTSRNGCAKADVWKKLSSKKKGTNKSPRGGSGKLGSVGRLWAL